MKVYVNGEIVNKSDAKISVFDYGFLLGEGLFETMRAYHGRVFMLDRHLKRLTAAAIALGFRGVPEPDTLAAACNHVLRANALEDARLRITLTPGVAGSFEPTVVITAEHYAGYDSAYYEKGMSAVTKLGLRSSNNPLHGLKTTSYLASLAARRDAVALGYDEAILINEDGNVTEGSYTNIFASAAGAIFTPPVSDGLLPGVSRECIIEAAGKAGYAVVQKSMRLDDLLTMEELFITNSLLEVMPLTKVNEYIIGDGRPGRTTTGMMGLYKERVLVELR